MGQKFAAYNAQGAITGYYDSVDSPVPADVTAIEITAAQWQACISSQSPYTVAGDALVAPVPPTAAQLLATAQTTQTALLNAAYQAAIIAPVSYTTAAGTTAVFNQTETAKANLQDALLASEKASAWSLNVWQAASGAIVTPFIYVDLQGLAAAMEAVDAPDYQTLIGLLAQVAAATTVEAVQAVVWP